MNRFDDKLNWRLWEKVIGPLLAALLTGAVIWGSIREKITNLEKIDGANRIAKLEVGQADIKEDVRDIKVDVKELLRRIPR
jgi:hypothetical protein